MGSVAVLRPNSPFAGVVEDDAGRPWLLHVAPSLLRRHVVVIARSAGCVIAGDVDIRAGVFDTIEPPGHGQRRPFLDRIAALLKELATQPGGPCAANSVYAVTSAALAT